MFDFGITKRKWLAFGILSAIFACLNAIIASRISQSVLHREANLLGGFAAVFIGTLVLLLIADALLGKFKEMFNVRIPKRYLAALVFAIAIVLPNQLGVFLNLTVILIVIASAIFGFAVSLVLYILSDFLAGLMFSSILVKSKSNEKKSLKAKKKN